MVVVGPAVFLVRVGGVEGGAFIDVRFPIPIAAGGATAIAFAGSIPGKPVPRIKHRDAIHEVANGAQTGERFCCGNRGRTGEPIERMLIDWQVGEIGWPRSHDVLSESRRPKIDPIGGRIEFLDARVGG